MVGSDSILGCCSLDFLSAKAGGAVNGGHSPFILTVDWLGWLCYLSINCTEILNYSGTYK